MTRCQKEIAWRSPCRDGGSELQQSIRRRRHCHETNVRFGRNDAASKCRSESQNRASNRNCRECYGNAILCRRLAIILRLPPNAAERRHRWFSGPECPDIRPFEFLVVHIQGEHPPVTPAGVLWRVRNGCVQNRSTAA